MGAKELWKTKAPARVKFFFWLALHQRLWTADRRKRHGLQDDDTCILCGQETETCDHLLAGCVRPDNSSWQFLRLLACLSWYRHPAASWSTGGRPAGSVFNAKYARLSTPWCSLWLGSFGRRGTTWLSTGSFATLNSCFRSSHARRKTGWRPASRASWC